MAKPVSMIMEVHFVAENDEAIEAISRRLPTELEAMLIELSRAPGTPHRVGTESARVNIIKRQVGAGIALRPPSDR